MKSQSIQSHLNVSPRKSTIETIQYDVEHTDTFGGEANYSWCTRKTLELPRDISDRALVRAAKAALGMTGVRCTKEDYGDTIRLNVQGACQVIFITACY